MRTCATNWPVACVIRHLLSGQERADRINSLSQSLDLLRTLGQQKLSDRLTWNVWLDEIACRRLLEEFGTAEQKLAPLESKSPPADVAPRLTAERIRLALAHGRIDEALSEAGRRRRAAAGELARSRSGAAGSLSGWLAASQQAASDGRRPGMGEDGPRSTPHDRTGPRSTLAAPGRDIAGPIDGAAPDLAALKRWCWPAMAIIATDNSTRRSPPMTRPRGRLARSARTSRRFEIAFTAATIEKGAGIIARRSTAIASWRFSCPAIRRARSPSPGDLQHRPVGRAAKAAPAQRVRAIAARALVQMAAQPDRITSLVVARTTRRARARLSRGRSRLDNVSPDHPQYAAALEAMGRCYLACSTSSPRRQADLAAGRRGDSLFRAGRGRRHRQANSLETRRTCRRALAAARIYLQEMPQGATQAESLLSRALATLPMRRELADRRPFVARRRVAARIASLKPKPRWANSPSATRLKGCRSRRRSAIWPSAEGRHAADIAALQLTVIDDLLAQRDEIDEPLLADLSWRRATALAGTGRRGEAIAAWQALAEANPHDGGVQEELALLLMAGDDAEQLRAAADKWRQISSKSRPGSPRWYRAFSILRSATHAR